MQTKITKLPKSEVEIEGEVEVDVFEAYFSKALKELGQNMELDGFRKGKVPDNVLLANLPEIKILEKMAELALSEQYPKIIDEHKLDVISRPEISITKLARKNPLGFKIKTVLVPEMTLPDYKKISKVVLSEVKEEDKNIEVTEKEVEDTILDIRKSRAKREHVAEHEHKEGETHDHPEPELPEFNDEFVKGLGPFEDIADFKDKLKINIKLEKENQLKEKTRLKIIEQIINESKMELPDVLIDIELNKIIYRMEADITQMGLKFEDYLKHLNKTIEDLRKEFRGDAEKKAKFGLVLNEIAKLEKITPDQEQVTKEVKHIMEHYKDADRERATLHAENVLTNEKVFAFLESQ